MYECHSNESQRNAWKFSSLKAEGKRRSVWPLNCLLNAHPSNLFLGEHFYAPSCPSPIWQGSRTSINWAAVTWSPLSQERPTGLCTRDKFFGTEDILRSAEGCPSKAIVSYDPSGKTNIISNCFIPTIIISISRVDLPWRYGSTRTEQQKNERDQGDHHKEIEAQLVDLQFSINSKFQSAIQLKILVFPHKSKLNFMQ